MTPEEARTYFNREPRDEPTNLDDVIEHIDKAALDAEAAAHDQIWMLRLIGLGLFIVILKLFSVI